MPASIDPIVRTHSAGRVGAPSPAARQRGFLANGRRRSADPAAETLAIIGNGMAGYKFCERLIALDSARRYRLAVFGEEPRPAYDRVRLTQLFSGRAPEHLQLAPLDWYQENGIELFTGDSIVTVDRERRLVRSRTGREVVYDRLVFATGSRAFVPDITGANLPGVFVYRTVEDLAAIRNYAPFCRRAAVLGGGLLGLEAAHALRGINLETWIVERGVGLLTRQLDPEASRLLAAQIQRLGIHVCTGCQTERIDAIGPDRLLQFTTGQCLRVQLVIIAAGIRPRDELAAACGLKLGQHGGIAVNDSLQTSDPNIFAVGECASHSGVIYGLAAPAYMMADVLAGQLVGRRRRFEGADQFTWLKLPGIQVATLGEFHADAEHLVCRPSGGYRRLVLEKNRLIGAVGVGDWPEQGQLRALIERGGRVWHWQRERFLRSGRVWRREAALPVSQWPENAIVCNCMGIRRGALSEACAQGCATVGQLTSVTGASTVCGSCKPLLCELIGAPALRHAVAGHKFLLVASLAALAIGILIWVAPRIPFADSVQASRKIEILWRSSFWKQATGYTLVGLAATSLLLSLRKRWLKSTFGEVGRWRAFHATLGALTLMALISHTGFRLGHNLNLILMTNFLALAVLGALAGAVTALESRIGGPGARSLRALWTTLHIALLWPLPALILFHVLIAYYF